MQFIESLLGQGLGNNQQQQQQTDPGMIGDLAQKFGLSSEQAQQIIKMGLPLIMGKLGQNAQTPSGAGSLFDALTQHENRQIHTPQDVDPDEGQKILGHVFGRGNDEQVTKEIANQAGLESDKVRKILTMLAPLALAYLAKKKKQNNMASPEDLRNYAGDMNKGLNERTGGKLYDILKNMPEEGQEQPEQQKPSGLGGLLGNLLGF